MKTPRKPSNSSAGLDAAELTQLALRAMRGGRDDDALRLLSRAIEANPKDGTPHHLRGAILASRGQMRDAIEAMTQALARSPQLSGARFQLGMLHFTSGNVVAAQSVWQAFDALDAHDPLRLFTTGMLHLAKDEFADCIALLEQGIALCGVESINKDMRRVIEKVKAVVSANPPSADKPDAHNPQHVLLSRYDQTSGNNNDA